MLFKEFGEKGNAFLSFHKLLISLAFMEPGHQFGELRAKFMFRYYDQDHDDHLNKGELARVLSKRKTMVRQTRRKWTKHLMHANDKHSIGLDEFTKAIASKQFRDTFTSLSLSPSPKDQAPVSTCRRIILTGTNTPTSTAMTMAQKFGNYSWL